MFKFLVWHHNQLVPGDGGTLLILGPISMWVLTGKKKGGWFRKKSYQFVP